MSAVRGLVAATTIDPQRMWRITSDLLLAFFARYLDGADARTLDSPGGDYAELTSGPP